jgi:hypothetical protein
MQPSRRPCFYASLALFAFLLCPPRTNAEALTITSSPSGATVEIDGIVVGTTPYQVKYPGGYFHKTKTVLGDRLEHAMVVRVSKDGYAPQEIQITEGPFQWVNLKGKNYGHYWLLKTNKIAATLQPLSRVSNGSLRNSSTAGREVTPLAPAAPATDNGSIEIVSDQPGADIYIDGQFVGQTPSTLHLPSGSHRIEVRSSGSATWARDLNVLKGSQLSLHASTGEQQ